MARPRIVIGDGSEHAGAVWPLFARMMIFEQAGDAEPAHVHKDGHWTALLKGRFRLRVAPGELTSHESPTLVWIPAGIEHELIADDAGAIACCLHDRRAFA
jgi:quercetin dioxygenase-like cupin family protein